MTNFPQPCKTPLPENTKYFYPVLHDNTYYQSTVWADDLYDQRLLERGLVHLTKENAIAHAKALIKLSGGDIE